MTRVLLPLGSAVIVGVILFAAVMTWLTRTHKEGGIHARRDQYGGILSRQIGRRYCSTGRMGRLPPRVALLAFCILFHFLI